MGGIEYKDIRIIKDENELLIQFDVDLSSLEMSKQLMISHIPVLQSADYSREHVFDPILVTGTIRNKVLLRQNGSHLSEDKALLHVVHKNKSAQRYSLTLLVSYESWMRDARLIVRENVTGCAGCDYGKKDLLVQDGLLPPVHVPTFELQYVMPEAEPVKHRSETYAAHVNFKVGRHELIRDFANNATVFGEVDKIVTEIREDENLTIQSMQVTGYASPEGDYNSNFQLSRRRTLSFVDYLVDSHGIEKTMIKTNWKGEDWDGLIEVLKSSSLSEAEGVIRIIESNHNISKRKNELKRLNGGDTYHFILTNYYPSLRRIEYTFSYVARPFDIEEAKEVVKTKPQHLSLNEIFLVANTYSKGSDEFNLLFDVAVRLFPQDSVANLNAAVQEIEMGAFDKGIERLQNINSPEAFNNLGVAYAKKGDFLQAKAYFQKAAESGNHTAQSNLEEIDLYLESK